MMRSFSLLPTWNRFTSADFFPKLPSSEITNLSIVYPTNGFFMASTNGDNTQRFNKQNVTESEYLLMHLSKKYLSKGHYVPDATGSKIDVVSTHVWREV